MNQFNIIKEEFIFQEDAFFNECHASSVLPLDDGKVMATWFAGTKEKHNDVSIWIGVRDNDVWNVFQAIKLGPLPHWNPVLHQGKDGSISLYFKTGFNVPVWITYVMKTYDLGKTWTLPKEVVSGDRNRGRGPVRCKMIYAKNGNLLAPASTEDGKDWDAFVDISQDDGQTWRKSNIFFDHRGQRGSGIIQPTLWLGENDCVHMLLRSSEGYIYRSDSMDNGETWCSAYKTELPNNNSGIDLVKLIDKRLVLIYNPVSDNWGKRTPISLSISDDNGATWHSQYDLVTHDGEYSYPAMCYKNNKLYISYTWNRKTIRYYEISVD